MLTRQNVSRDSPYIPARVLSPLLKREENWGESHLAVACGTITWDHPRLQVATNLFILFSEDTHETALHMCVQRHDSKFTRLLVKANADLNIRNNSGDRPIDIKQENEDVTNTLKAAMFEKDRVKKAKTS